MSDIKIGKSLITEEHDKIVNEYTGYISSLTSAMEKEYSYHTIRIAAIDDIENELNNIGLVIYTLYTRGDEIYISAKRIDDETYNIKLLSWDPDSPGIKNATTEIETQIKKSNNNIIDVSVLPSSLQLTKYNKHINITIKIKL